MSDPVLAVLDHVTVLRGLVDALLEGAGSTQDPPSIDQNRAADDRLRVLLVGLERLMNAAEGVQAHVITELGREALAADAAERGGDDRPIRSHEEFVPDEIAALLACTRAAASIRYGLAWRAQRYASVAATWRAGLIDGRKVDVIADQLQHLPPQVAASLAPLAAEHAQQRTAPQTREWLRRKVIAIDPEAAERRRQAALGERKVVITPSTDGMSDLWARLPSVEARRMQVALTKISQGLGADDPRTMDQRRADVLIDLVLGQRTPVGVDVQVVVPFGTTATGAPGPAWVPGLGPITAEAAAELIDCGATSGPSLGSVLVVDEGTGRMVDRVETRYRPSLLLDKAVRSRDVTCRFPGCRRSAIGRHSGTDLDHTVPWPEGATTGSNLAVLCRHHHLLKHAAGWQVSLHDDGAMTWRTPTGRAIETEPWSYIDPPDLTSDDTVPPSDETNGHPPDPP